MKKIETKAERDRRNKRNQIFLGFFMIAILVVSTLGFALFSRDEKNDSSAGEIDLNGLKFYRQDNIFVGQINGKNHAFFYLPDELDEVGINITNTLTNYMNKPLYFVGISSSINQLQFNLLPEYILRMNSACIEDEVCVDENSPMKDCLVDDIIIFLESEGDTKIYQRDKCIYIEGDLVKGTDKFLYKMLRII